MQLANPARSRWKIERFDGGVVVYQGGQCLHTSSKITAILTVDVVASEVPLQVHVWLKRRRNREVNIHKAGIPSEEMPF